MSFRLGLTLALLLPTAALAQAKVTDAGDSYVLTNGTVTAKVSKTSGDLVSLKTTGSVTPDVELMGYLSGHHAGYWEQNLGRAPRREAKITVDTPEVVEVSIKGFADGQSLISNAGAGQGGGLMADLELRYAVRAGVNGVYTSAIFTHPPQYPGGSVGESRFGMKLSGSVFDWLSVDDQRNAMMPTGKDWDAGEDLNMKEARRLTTGIYKGRAEHKYDYSADLWKTPAFGWSSTKQKVGVYLINPSMEYLSSGPLHFELTGHLDDGDGGDPTLLDYWRGTHYGGSELNFAAGESWSKFVGPILIYVPTGAEPQQLFTEAKQQAKTQAKEWPYAWEKSDDYTPAAQRSTIKGQLKIVDPQYQYGAKFQNLLVGLAYPYQSAEEAPQAPPPPPAAVPSEPAAEPQRDASGKIMNRGTYVAPRRNTGFRPPAQPVYWENDAKHYEFWVAGNDDGSFSIPNVRPGKYQLYAITDGVMGQYVSQTIDIQPGKTIDFKTIEWRPTHYGKQVWEIGTANRSAKEFLDGNDHWHWGMYIEYSKLFPKDVDFTIGKSNPAKDWFIYQVPHVSGSDKTGREQGRETPWKIHFTMPAAGTGRATLRFGLSGASTRSVSITVNGKDVPPLTGMNYNAVINRDGVEGSWAERDVTFDAALLKAGENTIVLTVPAGNPMSGVCYDVIRLEVAP